MIEPQLAKKEKLEAICQRLSQVEYRQQLLAAQAGRNEPFYEMETGSSIYPENSNAPRRLQRLETSTLDLAAEHFPGEQLFLKIDVQGAEIDVLSGAEITIERSAAVQLELPFINYNRGAPSFSEVITFMDHLDFSPAEISNMTILNGTLIQSDLIFLKKTSAILSEEMRF
jgi:FkbM family methyltransferase